MGDSVGRGSKHGGLSQLRSISKKLSFCLQKAFSNFVFLFFGATGILPTLPPIDTEELLSQEEAPAEVVSAAAYQTELCRWQKDFSFFNTLLDDKKGKEEEPCKEQAPAALATESVPLQVADMTLDGEIRELTAGYPLEAMAGTIAEYDRQVAALIVGIAKKESNWGKRVPLASDGSDCFNYWGYKGAGARGVAMGHGCFATPEEAVHAVGNRIAELVDLRQTSEPKNFTIWKCGSSCATHSPESVRKWIADVDLYYRKIVQN